MSYFKTIKDKRVNLARKPFTTAIDAETFKSLIENDARRRAAVRTERIKKVTIGLNPLPMAELSFEHKQTTEEPAKN